MSVSDPTTPRPRARWPGKVPSLLLLAILVAFIAAWPLIGQPGFLNTRGGGDSPFLLQRLHQLETALLDGHFPVRWMPDANYGYGYPFFNYYAPLSTYIAAFFRLFGYSYVQAVEFAQVAGFVVAAWGMYLLALRLLRTPWAGLLASVAYTVAPFHLVNIYVRGDSLAEFWAMAWYPWLLIAADALFAEPLARFPYGRAAALALLYAALILTHNISALIFSPFLLLFVLLRWLHNKRDGRFDLQENGALARGPGLPVVLALSVGLGLAAWFFIPALAEQDLAQLEPVTAGYFHYSNHFRGSDLVQPRPVFDYDVAGGNAFRLGLIQALATAAGAAALLGLAWRRRRVARAQAAFILLALLLATVMVTPLSRFLWDALPLLPFTQFPWRFLSVQALAAALATGALALLPGGRLLAILLAGLLAYSNLAGLQTDSLLVRDSDITAEKLAQYEWFTGNIGTTVSAEYLPRTVTLRPYTSPWLAEGERDVVRVLSGQLIDAWLQERRAASQVWQMTTAGAETRLMLPLLYWPGWAAAIDGQPLALAPTPGTGLITLDVPAGQHEVTLQLTRTPVRLVAEMISLLALLIALIWLALARRKRATLRAVVLGGSLLMALLLLLRLLPQPATGTGDETWDYARMAFLHHEEAGVPFDNGALLRRYAYRGETAAAGATFAISVQFEGARGQTAGVALTMPSSAWPGIDPAPPLVASQTQVLAAGHTLFELALPENAPAGLVVPRLTLEDARPLTEAGRPRGDIYLRPLPLANQRFETGPDGELDVWVEQIASPREGVLEVQLAWFTASQLQQDYKLSLRLVDGRGNWLAQLDTPPGYGFLPSSGWQPGAAVDDWLALALPTPLPSGEPLALVVQLYDAGSGQPALVRRLGTVTFQEGAPAFQPHEPQYELPQGLSAAAATFGEKIRLLGYLLEQDGSTVHLTLYWQPVAGGLEEYTRFVHVFDPQTEEIMAQQDGLPVQGTYPTSQWISGEIIADSLSFDLSALSGRSLAIATGLYQQDGQGSARLPVRDDESGTSLPGARVVLPQQIQP